MTEGETHKVIIKKHQLQGTDSDDLQLVAVVYWVKGEHRVYAPSDAEGRAVEWVSFLTVRELRHGGEYGVSPIIAALCRDFVESELISREPKQSDVESSLREPTTTDSTDEQLLVFISHSSRDQELAKALIDLLRAALGLVASQIRCSSVDGYRLKIGVNNESTLREEVKASKVLIGLITPSSLASHFVMFELGARWGANLFLAPLLAGVPPDDLRQPLSLINALSAGSPSQLIQMAEDVAGQLGKKSQSGSAYQQELARVVALAKATPTTVEDESNLATLRIENAALRERLDLKGKFETIAGHVYLYGDDREKCSRCAEVDLVAVSLQDMNLDGQGLRATCPECKTAFGHLAPPLPRLKAEARAQRQASG